MQRVRVMLLLLLVGADGALGLEGGVVSGGELQRQHLSHIHRGWGWGVGGGATERQKVFQNEISAVNT